MDNPKSANTKSQNPPSTQRVKNKGSIKCPTATVIFKLSIRPQSLKNPSLNPKSRQNKAHFSPRRVYPVGEQYATLFHQPPGSWSYTGTDWVRELIAALFCVPRRVYPVGEQYASLFQQPSGSLYTGTASSRARGDCTRIQREEFQVIGVMVNSGGL